MLSFDKILSPKFWIDMAQTALADGAKKAETVAPAPANVGDAQALDKVVAGDADVKAKELSPEFVKLKKQVHRYERAALMARTHRQQEHYYKKAMKLWQSGTEKMSNDLLFGGSEYDFTRAKFKNGSPNEKVQAALWMVGSRYGTMLGTFGVAGIDNKENIFTVRALEQFRKDYNAGAISGVLRPEKPLANLKEAREALLELAPVRFNEMDSLGRAALCNQARNDFGNPNPRVESAADMTYLYTYEKLEPQQAEYEAVQLRKMFQDTSLPNHVRWNSMRFYVLFAEKGKLTPTEMEVGMKALKEVQANSGDNYSLAYDAQRHIDWLAVPMAPFQVEPLNPKEVGLLDQAFTKPAPGEKLRVFSAAEKKKYQEAFNQLKAAAWLCTQVTDQSKGDPFEPAKQNYLKVVAELNISPFVRMDTLSYFADKSIAQKPSVAA